MFYTVTQTVTGWHCWGAASEAEFIDIVFHVTGELANSMAQAVAIDAEGSSFYKVFTDEDIDEAIETIPAAATAIRAELAVWNTRSI